jgi:hypothetical protein
MSKLRTVGAIAFLMGLLVATSVGSDCHTIHPAEGPGTSYPCGLWNVECANHACCPYKHECGEPGKGHFQTCPDGYCCYIGGDDWPGAGADGGARSGSPVKSVFPRRPR